MSPKKTILRELSRTHQENGATSFTRPAAINGFGEAPDKFQKAVNELLRSRLIEGRKDPEGHMAIALNEHRMDDVRRALRSPLAHPAVLSVAAAALVIVAFLVI
ncbi:MAG: hypothetical protein P8Z36_17875 [Gemmatimonadota bacterium]